MIGRTLIAFAALAVASAAGTAPHRPAQALKPQRGLASYYRATASGHATAAGKRPKPGALTAASKTLPLGTKAKVTNVETGKKVVVTVTDRGPFKNGRIVDVSPKAAERLGFKDDGVAPVKVQPLKVPAEK